MAALFTAAGEEIFTGQKLGEGGEGAVYEVKEHQEWVAKLYHKPLDARHSAKFRAMTQDDQNELQKIATWPVETLSSNPNGAVAGFLMQRISGYRPVHELYSPRSRRMHFPQADWRFLVHVAGNAARAFAAIHAAGHIIGDVNHGNLVVAGNGTVRLIDCDSFQISHNGDVFPCEVGVVEYTAPELHGADFSKTLRSQQQDAFGLALMVFHLLFMGRHPFAGAYKGQGDMPIDRAIRESRFAYSHRAGQYLMSPPPHTLSPQTLPQEVWSLFEKAFGQAPMTGPERPLAQVWIKALDHLQESLVQCSRNEAHYYPDTAKVCPWCALAKSVGVDLFIPAHGYKPGQTFDLGIIWAQILGIQEPGSVPAVHLPIKTTPSLSVEKLRNRLTIYRLLFVLIPAVVFISILGLSNQMGIAILIGAAFGIAAFFWSEKFLKEMEGAIEVLQIQWEAALREYIVQAGPDKFWQKRKELERIRSQYLKIDQYRQQELDKVKNNLYKYQLGHYLESFSVADVQIEGIGSGRKAMLQSYGIDTAANIDKKQVRKVPGIGKVLTQALLDWRASLERGFKFDPAKGIDPQDMLALEQKVAEHRKRLEQTLQQGPAALTQVRNNILHHRQRLKAKLDTLGNELAQAQYDLKYARKWI